MIGTGLRRLACAGLVAIASTAASSPSAEIREYDFEIPERWFATYEIEFTLEQPGVIELDAEWTGDRSLNFRFLTPDREEARFRRAGPSPRRLSFRVPEKTFLASRRWILTFHTVGGSDAGTGRLLLKLPDGSDSEDPPTVRRPSARLDPTRLSAPERKSPRLVDATSPTAPVEGWLQPRSRPLDARASDARLRNAIEDLRAAVRDPVTGAAGPDPCRWHRPLIEYLDRWHELYRARGTRPDSAHRRYLAKVADAIDAIARVRNGRDPLIHGPAPKERTRYRAWLAVRERRMHELESALDDLRTLPYDGFAPELAAERWPVRFAACLSNLERAYDRRILEGDATFGAELDASAWPTVLRARSALRALAALPRRR